ncbi:hypothetical protein J3P91_20175 [Pseudomonas sp. Z4-7]|uniref:hypothetical protein n=1 Tax=Pseudomonas sp. Z4-7 TaxID=2817413 RepID=UPI003DAA36F6
MAAERKTLSEYLKWASLEPRTSDWDALVAYDRDKCNQLLLQEYVEKHHTNSMMPPINEAYGVSESTWRWKLDYVTDTPRLSFHNNPDNTGEVMMSMAVVGGKDISLDDTLSFPQVTRIGSYDPLDHPTLEARKVPLKEVQGSVNDKGEVQLDLGDSASQNRLWLETCDRIPLQQKKAGAFFKRKFRETPEEKRQFHLGMLDTTTQEIIKPASFKLRTIMEVGGDSLEAENYGNGALEMRIAMEGSMQGGLPGDDWSYPLPSDQPDLNASMLFGSNFFMHEIIGKGTARAFSAPNATFKGTKDDRGFVHIIEVESTDGYLEIPEFEASHGAWKTRFFGYRLPIFIDEYSKLTMTMYRNEDGTPHLRVGMGNKDIKHTMTCVFDGGNYTFQLGIGLSADYAFSLDAASRRLHVELRSAELLYTYIVTEDVPLAVWSYLASREFSNTIQSHAANAVLSAINGLEAIDLFILNSIIFNTDDAVQLKRVDPTGDLVLFGAISPRLTTFAIDPMEVKLGYDEKRQFSVTPTPSGTIDWSVEDLDGGTLGVGTIDSQGLYTAPALADIHGTYMRVKVTASIAGVHTTRALVTVVARTITLNPLIEICNASKPSVAPETRELSAHTLNGALKWSVVGSGSIPADADGEGKNLYTAPFAPEQSVESFTIDEVVVKNTTTDQEQNTLMVVKYRPQLVVIEAAFEQAPYESVKLVASFNDQIPTEPLAWRCIPADAGEVDPATGIFTASGTTSSQFVLITVILDLSGMKLDGFTILPLPLSPLPDKPIVEEDPFPDLETLNVLLDAVSEELKSINPSANASEEIKGCLQRIATLAEDNRNGQ